MLLHGTSKTHMYPQTIFILHYTITYSILAAIMKVQQVPFYLISLIQAYWIDFFSQLKKLSPRHYHTVQTRSYGWERLPAAMMEEHLSYLTPILLDSCMLKTSPMISEVF